MELIFPWEKEKILKKFDPDLVPVILAHTDRLLAGSSYADDARVRNITKTVITAFVETRIVLAVSNDMNLVNALSKVVPATYMLSVGAREDVPMATVSDPKGIAELYRFPTNPDVEEIDSLAYSGFFVCTNANLDYSLAKLRQAEIYDFFAKRFAYLLPTLFLACGNVDTLKEVFSGLAAGIGNRMADLITQTGRVFLLKSSSVNNRKIEKINV